MADQALAAINDPEVVRTILRECHTIAVVGMSSNPLRPSYDVSRYMQKNGYRIIPVNPVETQILGEAAFPDLESVPDKVDLVNIFRRSDQAGVHVDEAIKIGARAVWLQEDVIDEAAAARAQAAGLLVVMDRCLLKEHIRNKQVLG